MKVFYDSRPNFFVTATGSASPVIEKGAGDSGVGRWNIIRVPTLSFYEYCKIARVPDLPVLNDNVKPSKLVAMTEQAQREIIHLWNLYKNILQGIWGLGGSRNLFCPMMITVLKNIA